MTMAHYLNSFKERHADELNSSELDKRLLELSALFEISQTLNSSLNLKAILDNILLVPMGRMMISKGIILFESNAHEFKIKNLKGLPFSLLGKEIHISRVPEHPLILKNIDPDEDWIQVFRQYKLELILPLTSKRDFKGIIGYGAKLNGAEFSSEEIEFLSSLGNIAVQSIDNALMFDKLNKVNRELDQKIQELNTLFEIGKELNQIFDPAGILKQVSYSLMGQMLVNQFFVVLKNKDSAEIAFKKGSTFSDEKLERCLSQKMPELNAPLLIGDQDKFSLYNEMGVQLIVPMEIQGETGGYIFLGEKLDRSPYSASNISFLSTLANMTMISLENARLIEETIAKQRLEEELSLAKSIQSRLLPQKMPQLKGYDLHGINLPSKQVGGDYFDVIDLGKNEIILTVADVSGKGMPASLLMSNLQAALQTLCDENYSLAQITAKLNNLIHRNTSVDKYITFFLLKLNTVDGRYQYVNAGHNPPYHFQANLDFSTLDAGGLILGMMPDVVYETGQGILDRGECITMFTDGVTEAMNEQNREFEEKRVIEFFRRSALRGSAEQLNLKLIEEITAFAGDPTQSDDVTILTIKRL